MSEKKKFPKYELLKKGLNALYLEVDRSIVDNIQDLTLDAIEEILGIQNNCQPSPALQDAVKETFGAIHLFAKEGHAVVSIEVNDKWIELMKEPLDSPFSHIIEPLGIQRKIEESITSPTA